MFGTEFWQKLKISDTNHSSRYFDHLGILQVPPNEEGGVQGHLYPLLLLGGQTVDVLALVRSNYRTFCGRKIPGPGSPETKLVDFWGNVGHVVGDEGMRPPGNGFGHSLVIIIQGLCSDQMPVKQYLLLFKTNHSQIIYLRDFFKFYTKVFEC